MIIKKITEIIDKGGPYFASQGISRNGIGIYNDIEEIWKPFGKNDTATWIEMENECEQLNSDYVANAILKCLQQAPLDFKSVYDKQIWIDTIEKMISK